MKIRFAFNCPYHGEEIGVFCFRALQPKNEHLWIQYELHPKQIDLDPEMLQPFLNMMRCSTTETDIEKLKLLKYGYGT